MADEVLGVSTWSDARLLDLIEHRSDCDSVVAAPLATEVLRLRRGLQTIAVGDACAPTCTTYLQAMALLGCPHTLRPATAAGRTASRLHRLRCRRYAMPPWTAASTRTIPTRAASATSTLATARKTACGTMTLFP